MKESNLVVHRNGYSKMKYLDFHTHQLSNDEECIDILNIRQGEKHPLSYKLYGYGIHPWDSFQEIKLELTNEVTNDKNLIYIGETGLDKLKGAELHVQIEIFKQHIHASEKYKKPLVIHCVRSFNELIQLHKEFSPTQRWIVHGFTGSPELAKELTEVGFMLSFGDAIINKKRKAAQSLKKVSNSLFLLETDDSTIPIQKIYETAADIIEIKTDELKKIVLDNFSSATSIQL